MGSSFSEIFSSQKMFDSAQFQSAGSLTPRSVSSYFLQLSIEAVPLGFSFHKNIFTIINRSYLFKLLLLLPNFFNCCPFKILRFLPNICNYQQRLSLQVAPFLTKYLQLALEAVPLRCSFYQNIFANSNIGCPFKSLLL